MKQKFGILIYKIGFALYLWSLKIQKIDRDSFEKFFVQERLKDDPGVNTEPLKFRSVSSLVESASALIQEGDNKTAAALILAFIDAKTGLVDGTITKNRYSADGIERIELCRATGGYDYDGNPYYEYASFVNETDLNNAKHKVSTKKPKQKKDI